MAIGDDRVSCGGAAQATNSSAEPMEPRVESAVRHVTTLPPSSEQHPLCICQMLQRSMPVTLKSHRSAFNCPLVLRADSDAAGPPPRDQNWSAHSAGLLVEISGCASI